LDIRIRLQAHYPAGYPAGKRDSDPLWFLKRKSKRFEFANKSESVSEIKYNFFLENICETKVFSKRK